MFQLQEKFGIEIKQYLILKKREIYKAEIIESIPQGEDVSIYFHGDWHDLCRGPHYLQQEKLVNILN